MFPRRAWIASALILISARPSFQQNVQQPFHLASNFSTSTAATSAGNMTRGAVIGLSHGGGPMPVLGDEGHREIVSSLKNRVPKVLKLGTPEAPRAIVIVTAHWSTKVPTVSSGNKHSLYYDYGGFPEEAYKLKYDAPGSPEVAQEVYEALQGQGFSPQLDDKRGWDHGVFIPMLLIHPAADIPIVQLSVLRTEEPEEHFRMGLALQKLRDTNVAIIGSGFASFHNLRLMFSGVSYDPAFQKRNQQWNAAVADAVAQKESEGRLEKLKSWRMFPGGYEMHPPGGAEHFMPLIVCAGAGGEVAAKSYTDEFMALDMYSFYWE